ncbi:MAG: riboflavin biosynthesis protein RibF [Paludibacteraceae bacterium]|nr:riboflavin biosynthesis protein RibF [Paludibacteraceae bacterium]
MSSIATIGFFDGVHRGHQFLFNYLRSEAKERGLRPLIVTFKRHPRVALEADYIPQLLTSPSEREALLSKYGEVLMLPFEDFHTFTAEQFMAWLKANYGVSVLLMGYDHRFGSDRLKNPRDYRRIGESIGMEVLTTGEYTETEWHVSSTEIRMALEAGNILLANELLGRPYALVGTVVHGKGVGRTIGFPTANIAPLNPHKVIPKPGVYMAHVDTPAMDNAPAFVNIDKDKLIEVHVPSFKGDLYDQQLEIKFLRFIREEKHFESLEALREQIKDDIDSILRPDA